MATGKGTLGQFSSHAGDAGREAVLDMELGGHRILVKCDFAKLCLVHQQLGDTIREMVRNQEKIESK
jgi:hypothetical protein